MSGPAPTRRSTASATAMSATVMLAVGTPDPSLFLVVCSSSSSSFSSSSRPLSSSHPLSPSLLEHSREGTQQSESRAPCPGDGDEWTAWRDVEEGVMCNNDVFGDPAPHKVKICQCRPEIRVCAAEGESCRCAEPKR